VIGEALEHYRAFVAEALPGLELYEPGDPRRAVEAVQAAVGTPEEISVAQLYVPELLNADTLNVYGAEVVIVAPRIDEAVVLVDQLLERLTRNQGGFHNRFRPRTRRMPGLAYEAIAVLYEFKL
jgi:hypothetical protein